MMDRECGSGDGFMEEQDGTVWLPKVLKRDGGKTDDKQKACQVYDKDSADGSGGDEDKRDLIILQCHEGTINRCCPAVLDKIGIGEFQGYVVQDSPFSGGKYVGM